MYRLQHSPLCLMLPFDFCLFQQSLPFQASSQALEVASLPTATSVHNKLINKVAQVVLGLLRFQKEGSFIHPGPGPIKILSIAWLLIGKFNQKLSKVT